MAFLQFSLGSKAPAPDTELLLSDSIPRNGHQTKFSSNIATDANEAAHPAAISSIPPKPTRKFLNGWRSNVILSILTGTSILILNICVTVWASTKSPSDKGVTTVHEGLCSGIKTAITRIHLAVNILSTLLLAASNACMQILCAPTREEVDAAHARHKWLRIGVPSLKNLFYIDRKKSAIWVLLGLSSVPLHLLWNSAFVDTLSSNDYVFSAITEGFLQGDPYNNTQEYLTNYSDVAKSMLDSHRNQSLTPLTVTACMKEYGKEFVSEYGNLLLIYDFKYEYNSLLIQGLNYGISTDVSNNIDTIAGGWMCDNSQFGCDFAKLNATYWNPWHDIDLGIQAQPQTSFVLDGKIEYCLAKKINSQCRLDVSRPIMVIVLICNVVKTICFLMTLLIGGSMYPLVTNGDAVQSFLLRPDIKLQGRCLISRSDVDGKDFWSEQSLPRSWRSKRRPWAVGATKSDWLAMLIPAIVLITTIFAIFSIKYVSGGGSGTVVSSGFGTPRTDNFVKGGIYGKKLSPAAASLLANTPQILVSYIYLAYNALFTSMLATAEWVSYSVRRQGLRVAWPRGQQRATSFLSLPYIYAVPIMGASALLHWLISESLFLVRITNYKYNETENKDGLISTVGFSPYPTVFAMSTGGAMLIVVLLLGVLRRYPGTMPLAACCSASIAALCQPQEDIAKDELTLTRLQWGVVDQGLSTNGHGEVEHACFSAGQVAPLIPGRIYA